MRRRRDPFAGGTGALDLVEEASVLLMHAPATAWLWYAAGTLPFLFVLVRYILDMSGSPTAAERIVPLSFLLSCLFLWMKHCHALFGRSLHFTLRDQSAAAFTLGEHFSAFFRQAAIVPWGAAVLPLAALVTLPFGWCWAYFQNASVLAALPGDVDLSARARRDAAAWPGQNHLLLGIVLLWWLFVFLNVATLLFLIPQGLKTFFDFETPFSRSGLRLLGTLPFWGITFLLTNLCVDPLMKGCYLLRCFYAESMADGADLMADLRNCCTREK